MQGHQVAGARSAWLLMAVGDDRQHGGNSGYDDQADVYYTWDSTVANSENVKAGDPIVLWDKRRLLGVSVIEEIESRSVEKLLFKCPRCHKAGIKARTTKRLLYKCYKCKHEFDEPRTKKARVIEYRSRHDAAWTPLDGGLSGQELRLLCVSPKSQHSMRALHWDLVESAMSRIGAARALDRVDVRADVGFTQGFKLQLVRVRRGQTAFRQSLLKDWGQQCAFTGTAPERVLEAGHLYSYARLGEHERYGGMLLRRDVHRLFDDGWLAVDPATLRVDVADALEIYPQYARLQDQALSIKPKKRQVEWLAQHWAEHRVS